MHTMSGWKYRTRGDEQPHDLPQVYLCCHPQDFGECFERVTNEILTHVRCAVWYTDADTPRDQDFFTTLATMDMVVALVTEKFLTEESAAMDTDIPFVLGGTTESQTRTNIPLLPLVWSSAAETIYQKHEKLKNIQYICMEQKDSASQPYQEKLKAYLDAVLLNAELMEKIRGAFDAYIFFSYRKQDRASAQKLMDFIHQQPFCRDIALWYDNYLPTGEDFYSNIQAILDKSALFVLSFTDSVLEDVDGHHNFVIREEIPSAYGKIQMLTVQTSEDADPFALVAKIHPYLSGAKPEQIQEELCIVPNTEAAVGSALFAQLKKVPCDKLAKALYDKLREATGKDHLTPNEHDPEHHYLIGLAYLHGVDTVKDAILSAQLLDIASQKGQIDATEKLVQMYRYGVGVKRDIEKALAVQERLITQRQQRYLEDNNIYVWNEVFQAFILRGDILEDEKKHSDAQEAYESALAFLKSPSDYGNRKLYGRNLLLCYSKLGDVCLAQDNLVYARDYYQMSLNISERLAKQVSGGVSQRDQYLSYLRLGDICMAEDTKYSLAEAAQHYEQAYEIAGLIEDPPDMLEWQWDMNTIHTCLGDVYLRQGQYDDAMDQFNESKKILSSLGKSDDSIHMELSRAICYERIGVVWYKKCLLIMAQGYFEKCVSLHRSILAREESSEHRANLGWALYLLACSVEKEERSRLLKEAIEIYDVLLREDPGNRLYRGRYKDFQRFAKS